MTLKPISSSDSTPSLNSINDIFHASEVPFSKNDTKFVQKRPIPVILGPTGSGKTKIAIDLARELNGEIISADSRAIYRGLDLGTAKPTAEEQALVPHHGLDLVELGDRFTVADWKAYAEPKIAEIESRGHLPIIAGGTGLYIDALIFDYQFRGPTGAKINDFEQKSCSDRKEVKGDFLLIGLDIPREELRNRLHLRIDQMFTSELFEESKKVVQSCNSVNSKAHGSDSLNNNASKTSGLSKSSDNASSVHKSPDLDAIFAKAGNIYRFAHAYLAGELSLDEAKEKAFYADYHLAKRQLTWFKRNLAIVWLPPSDVVPYVKKQFKNLSTCAKIVIE